MNRGSMVILVMAIITLPLVIYVNEGINGFSLWNSLPIFIALITLLVEKTMVGIKYAIYGFAGTIITTIFIAHASSLVVSGKIFPMASLPVQRTHLLPVYSVGAGYIVGMIGVVAGAWHDRNNEHRSDKLL